MQLPELRQAAHDVEDHPDNLSALKKLLDAGTGSLGGARPKASVQDGGRLAIAKFTHEGDQWAVIAWEAALLRMAGTAGITVPKYQLVHVGRMVSAQRDSILASVRKALGTWRDATDACRIPRSDLELFAPLLDHPPRGLEA